VEQQVTQLQRDRCLYKSTLKPTHTPSQLNTINEQGSHIPLAVSAGFKRRRSHASAVSHKSYCLNGKPLTARQRRPHHRDSLNWRRPIF